MIDVSDGLSSDLAHLCEESGVGAEVDADRIPLSRSLRTAGALLRPPLFYALSGGEDYERLFTVPARKAGALRDLRIPAAEIGRITKGRAMALLEGGARRPLVVSGYDHFGRRASAKGKRR
jgi:thiamine-monophosphate kinase